MDRKRATISVATLFALLGLGAAADASDVEAGKALYDMNCSSCHGMTGKGDGPISATLNPKPRDFSSGEFKFDADKNGTTGEDADLKLVIQKGALAYGGSPLMTGWPTFKDDQIADVIAYIRSLAAK